MVNLISPAYLKSFCPEINPNVDDNMIIHSISKMQKMKMQKEVIGKVYLDYLMNVIETSGETALTADDTTIMDNYFKPLLALYSFIDMLPRISYVVDNSGVREKSVNESVQTSRSNISYLQQNTEAEITYYLNELTWFLNENSSKYEMALTCKYGTPNRQNSEFSGIFFPKKQNRKSNGYDW